MDGATLFGMAALVTAALTGAAGLIRAYRCIKENEQLTTRVVAHEKLCHGQSVDMLAEIEALKAQLARLASQQS